MSRQKPDYYKFHYACFYCRKAYRHARPADNEGRVLCPECGRPMHNMGRDFRAPRQEDVDAWRQAQRLIDHTTAWEQCRCSYPKTASG
jgi:hypothetical protein